MPEKIRIGPTKLRRLYQAEKLSLRKIAEKVGCSVTTVRNRMVEHGIPWRTSVQEMERITVDCEWCGTPKQVIPSHYEKYERFFCDNKCQGNYLKTTGLSRGRNNGRWKGRVPVSCANCGKQIEIYPCRIDEKEHHLCKQECRAQWYSDNLSGRNSPHWREDYERDYNGNWLQVRKRVRERDGNQCRLCGVGKRDIGRIPDVHHIRALRTFENPQEAHTMDNLVQLCPSCHS